VGRIFFLFFSLVHPNGKLGLGLGFRPLCFSLLLPQSDLDLVCFSLFDRLGLGFVCRPLFFVLFLFACSPEKGDLGLGLRVRPNPNPLFFFLTRVRVRVGKNPLSCQIRTGFDLFCSLPCVVERCGFFPHAVAVVTRVPVTSATPGPFPFLLPG